MLSNQQLAENFRGLRQPPTDFANEADRMQQTIHELQVHQVELEMQNRALRESQDELEHSIRRYADLYDHLPIGYVTVTPAGHILEANIAAGECLRRDRQQLIGRLLSAYLDSYDAGRFAAHLEGCVRAGRQCTIELTLRHRDGSRVAVQFSSRLAPTLPGTPRQVHIAITDISRLKKTQRVLEEINREQEAFNYSVSHDLRAPLVTISNYARIVAAEHGAALDDEAKAMMQRIERAAVRMEATLKNLLEYSRLAREEISLEPVKVEDVMGEVLIEHRGVIQERQADVAVERPMHTVRGSRLILSQVFANLLTNALKYTQVGERPRVRFASELHGSTVRLKVIDEGIGIEAKHHERIFQVFERLHGYSHYPGSGVGLAIARRAVERMNGRIWVESELGKGSCFCLELPSA